MPTNNNAAQTLFRFVSLRNPKLTETKNKNLGFIFRPEGLGGIFDENIHNNPEKLKMLVLQETTKEYEPQTFKSVKELEESEFSQLLKIGERISKKQQLKDADYLFTKDYFLNLFDENMMVNEKAIFTLELIWNNLIYQTVTQKDFYIKEAVSHILKAIHLGFAQNTKVDDEFLEINGKDFFPKSLEAKIVLPESLFVDNNENSSANTGTQNLSNATLQRLKTQTKGNLTANQALHKKEMLEKLNAELETIKTTYFKASEKAYQTAYSAYLDKNKAQIEEYEKKLEEFENLKEDTPEEEKQRLYDALKELEVAPFQYLYPNQLDLTELKAKLSATYFALFMELFSDATPEKTTAKIVSVSENQMRIGTTTISINPDIETFDEALAKIQNNISAETQTVFDNSTLLQQQYINLGGALVPVATNTATQPLAYSMMANYKQGLFSQNFGFVDFSFEVQDNSWGVANAIITATTNLGNFEEDFGNLQVQNNKITLPAMLVNQFSNITSFKAIFYFENGNEANLELFNIGNNEILTGILTLKPTSENPRTEPSDNAKPRNNFGIKRLGIADYMKVVQSVHAYVPGEVSNIENVMASELRHKSVNETTKTEDTLTTGKSQEVEKISDTTKTSRTDMQTEVAKEVEKQQAITAHTRFSFDKKPYSFEIGAEYANNTSQHDSTRQAVMKSQEITERAMERVLTKISEERIQKIMHEVTLQNVHEFDNRGKGDGKTEHITGVYRWIDMKYKNQIYNYGKRSMFEFMVPEPAKLHRLALSVAKANVLTAPVDPRTAPSPYTMPNPKAATTDLLQYWAQIYNVTLTNLPEMNKTVSDTQNGGEDGTFIYSVPDNYTCLSFDGGVHYVRTKGWHNAKIWVYIPTNSNAIYYNSNPDGPIGASGFSLENSVKITYNGSYLNSVSINLNLHCKLTDAFIQIWKTENFNEIIKAYEKAYQDFQEAQTKLDAEQKTKEAEAKEKQSNFYRYMEQDVLKHNCIAYLLQDYLTILGQNFTNGDKMENFQVYLNEDLDKYTALAKFMEQAMEWEIMDYTFYPYYWANRNRWQEMYISESVDPLFRSFLQAGMARVIVTVKPSFEDAVQLFLETGLIWNGGEVPVIGDPLYLSIVDEMREPLGIAQGKYWITRIPTTLTILQDKSTGLAVDQPLPIFPEEDPTNCENPEELETESSFELKDVRMQGNAGVEATLPKQITNVFNENITL